MAFTVYYLDDEAEICAVFSAFLTSMEIPVKTFTDAAEAIEYCKHTPPDLIFIDYRLADTTGDLVANSLYNDISKILVTGDLLSSKRHLFIDVINKPFRLKNIESVIQKYRAGS